MPNATMGETFVVLCNWRGRCIWTSAFDHPLTIGEFVWSHLTAASQADAKRALAEVVTLRENKQVEVVNRRGERFRGWLWPLDSPEVAVCVLGVRVPRELKRLSGRERQCLEFLARGMETKLMAKEFDVSISTIHTHLKRAREKLGLPNIEALISFSARYCFPADRPFGKLPSVA